MHKRRIISDVAREMGANESVLSAKLRPNNRQAGLRVDELVPLVNAVRRLGFGKELDGVLYRFVASLKDEEVQTQSSKTSGMLPQILTLAKGLGILSECAARIDGIGDASELERLAMMVRTEVLPVVLQMEYILSRRLEKVRRRKGNNATVQNAALALAAPK